MSRLVGVVLLVAAVAVAGVGLVMTGVISPPGGSAYPACGTLPTVPEVESAVQEHRALVDELQAVGEGVEVEVTKPCADQDAAAITIWYANGDESAAIGRIMNSESFGVVAVPRQR